MTRNFGMARNSQDFLFTVTDRNDPRIADAKLHASFKSIEQSMQEIIAKIDRQQLRYRKRYRIVVRGRLGKDNPNAHLYRRGGSLYRSSSQDIRPEHATRFDVYLREVRVWPKNASYF
jgi:hypothetical protein